jgi:hypothetical protein
MESVEYEPDLPDVPEDENLYTDFIKECEEANIEEEEAYILFAGDIDTDNHAKIMREISKAISGMTPSSLDKLTEKMKNTRIERTRPKPLIVRLLPGTVSEIRKFIKAFSNKILADKPKDIIIDINVPSDTSEERMKNTFIKYITAGFLGCVHDHGYSEVAEKLFCFAYSVEKTENNGELVYRMNRNVYSATLTSSLVAYQKVLQG